MKRVFFSILVLICVLSVAVGCDGKSDYNYTVTEQDIEDRMLYNKFTNEVTKAYLEETLGKGYEEELPTVVLPVEAEEVKKSLEEDNLIIEHCKKNEVYIDEESAAETAKKEYQSLTTEEATKTYYFYVQKTLQEYEMTEERYVELLCKEGYYRYNRVSLKAYFGKKMYDENSKKSLDDQFDSYIDDICGRSSKLPTANLFS